MISALGRSLHIAYALPRRVRSDRCSLPTWATGATLAAVHGLATLLSLSLPSLSCRLQQVKGVASCKLQATFASITFAFLLRDSDSDSLQAAVDTDEGGQVEREEGSQADCGRQRGFNQQAGRQEGSTKQPPHRPPLPKVFKCIRVTA